MIQGDESPLFCRDDTPPRSGVPPGYVSIRPLLLQRQHSASGQQTRFSAEFEDEAPRTESEIGVPLDEDDSTSSALANFDDNLESHAVDAASVAMESDPEQTTFLPTVPDQPVYQSFDEGEDPAQDESQVYDSFSESLVAPAQEDEHLNKAARPQRWTVGDQSPLFCREDTPDRSGVSPGYKSVMRRRAREIPSPVSRDVPAMVEETQNPRAQPNRTALLSTQSRKQPSSLSIPTASASQPAPPRPLAQQQRLILPYVFTPSAVPQTPMESTLADPLVTKWQAQSGAAVYPKHSLVTTTTSEGLYTLTDGQVYWNSRGRRQCFKLGCDNNHGIGYTTEQSRDEHISNSRFHKEVPHHGFEQTKRGYRKSHA